MGRRAEEGERTIARTLGRATGGADLSTGELLALQAGIYRYTEALDLASKFVDRMGNGVRTLLRAG
ncbi:MAG: hypothetical protein U0169_13775 [Polyangiaceae bacterium]